ncbi:MAG: zinc dependent phospholipase C family protein [bacterium]
MIIYFFVVLFVYLFSPSVAHAWGPGAHLEYALHALSQIALLAPPIRALLKKHPNDFLYGTIAADIILGKKFAGELYHCHHWEVALPLLHHAQDERQQAFIYGYLTHLSVDTVAHNYFVPYSIIKSYEAYTLRHTYWEMRYDLKMPLRVWDVLKELAEGDYHRNDVLLARSLKKALFSFKTNKRIFDSLMLLQRMKRWRGAAELMASRSNYALSDDEVREFKGLCYDIAVDFLQHVDRSRALQADPTGKLKLLYAKEMSAKLKKYTNRGILSRSEAEKLVFRVKKSLREGIYKTVQLPDVYDVV